MEFEFKIIGVEKGTHSLTSENGDKWDVDNLPDAPNFLESAPKKRVIELPADLLEKLTVEKENASGLLGFFDMDGHSAEIMNWLGEFLPEPDNLEPENIAADWYLDHVEFVPKKEPKFEVEVDLHDTSGNWQQGHIWQNDKHGEFTPYMDIDEPPTYYNHKEFTEQEADEIIEKLGGEDGLIHPRKLEVNER